MIFRILASLALLVLGAVLLVVIASLTAVSPSTPCTLDDVMRNLEKMGIKMLQMMFLELRFLGSGRSGHCIVTCLGEICSSV